LHYHDPKTNFSEKDTMILWAEICQLCLILREKMVFSCHIGYSNLAHSSCGSGVHLIHKIEKRKGKNHASNQLNIATQYVVVEPLYRSK
jgi:hypothetical protein